MADTTIDSNRIDAGPGSDRPKVLIADDLAENRELLREPIEPHGFDPFLVPNGSLALTLAHQLQPNLSPQLQQAAENYASSELMRLLDSLEKSAGPNPSIDQGKWRNSSPGFQASDLPVSRCFRFPALWVSGLLRKALTDPAGTPPQ